MAGNQTAPPVDPARAAENNAGEIMGIMGAFLALSLPFVVLRLYSRIKIVKSASWDDACMAVTSLCTIAAIIIFGIQTKYGLGRHRDTLSVDEARNRDKLAFFQAVNISVTGYVFLKLSIGLCLLRLHVGIGGWYRWTLWGLLAIVIAKGIMDPFTFFLRCRPLAGHWDKTIVAKCYPYSLYLKFGIASTLYDLITNISFAIIPIPVVIKLNMKRKTRLYLICILSVGWIAVFTGIVKVYYQFDLFHNKDSIFRSNYQIWNYIQINLAIAAACAPMLRPIFGKALGMGSKSSQPIGPTRGHHSGPHRRKSLPYDVELEDGLGERADHLSGTERGDQASMTFYRHNSTDHSEGEDLILQGGQKGHTRGRIIKTTEFSVQQADRDGKIGS